MSLRFHETDLPGVDPARTAGLSRSARVLPRDVSRRQVPRPGRHPVDVRAGQPLLVDQGHVAGVAPAVAKNRRGSSYAWSGGEIWDVAVEICGRPRRPLADGRR